MGTTTNLDHTVDALCDHIDRAALLAGEEADQLLHRVALHCRSRKSHSRLPPQAVPVIAPLAAVALDVVEKHFGIDRKSILGPKRPHSICLARHAAFRILRQNTGATFAAIASAFFRDTSAVMHGLRSVTQRIDTEVVTRAIYEAAEREFRSRVNAVASAMNAVEVGTGKGAA